MFQNFLGLVEIPSLLGVRLFTFGCLETQLRWIHTRWLWWWRCTLDLWVGSIWCL